MAINEMLSASQEDYMESIFHIVGQKHAARVKDIAGSLGVTPASVTGALGVLAKKGLVNYVPYGIVTLTSRGKKVSKGIVQRHEILRDFFVKVLSIDREIADRAACGMEHALPHEILNRLTQFLKFTDRCARCLEEFHRPQSKTGSDKEVHVG